MVAETSCRAKRGKNNALNHLASALNEHGEKWSGKQSQISWAE